jgi:hypothetical protein
MVKLVTIVFILIILCVRSCVSTEIKYTSSSDAEDSKGPLPLSKSQRDQLTRLEQAIVQSPDPEATLKQVAQSNNMDPQDLINLLERNRSDMTSASASSSNRSIQGWPQQISKLSASAGIVLSQLATRNPKLFTIIALSLIYILYIGINVPRNGVILSGHSSLFSRGHTTLWLPPPKYVDRYMNSQKFVRKRFSVKEKILPLGDIEFSAKDGIQWLSKLGRKSSLHSLALAQETILVDDFTRDDIINEENILEEPTREELVHTIFDEAAGNVLVSRRLTEFTDNNIRFQCSTEDRKRSGILVIPRSGDWGRYGLQPLQVVAQSEESDYIQIRYSTLEGGVFDGQIHVVAERISNTSVVVKVKVLLPKKGRKLNRKLATLVATTICSSIARSIRTEANKRLTRQLQGRRFTEKANLRAAERREFRHNREKEIEEMAADRRRRWQRGNPDAGRYRPSGHRMKSPNNC